MNKSVKKEKGLTWIERMAKHPLILLAGLVVAVIALVVMVVLFFWSQTERELVYAVNPVKTRVVTMGQSTELEIRYEGVELGDVDITAAQIAIWNAGEESIRRENILKEVVICTDPAVEILEVSIVKHSREFEVTELTVLDQPELIKTGRVSISWSILEKNDGASIQLIYLGSPDVDIMVEGLIESSGSIERVGREVKIKTPIEQVRSEESGRWFLLPAAIFLFVAAIYFSREVIRDWKKDRKMAIFELIVLISYVGIIAFSIWYAIGRGPFGPPFGY